MYYCYNIITFTCPEYLMLTLDRNSPIPLYHQLKQILLEKMAQGEWKAGDLLPSEQELQDTYGLSRITVRQTLGEMVNDGLLLRQRGRGTFVARAKIAHDPAQRFGISDYMRQQGIEPGWQVIDEGWMAAPPSVAEALQLSADGQVYRIRRLRLANDERIGYHLAYLPPTSAEFIHRNALLEGESLAYLQTHPQMATSRAHRTIEAIPAGDDETEWLNIEPDAPILRIQRLITAEDGTVLEFLCASYRGDRFKYQITI